MQYTPNQQKAIDFWEGNLQIIACAGSGKTDVITRRIAKLVSFGVPTREIVAFTFTENAAEEMKFRIRKHLQEFRPENPEIGEMFVGTIHSFCFKLLQDFKAKYKGYDVLDEHRRIVFVSAYDNAETIGLDKLFPERGFKNFETFCFNIDITREEMIDFSKLSPTFHQCLENYNKLLDRDKYLDFSGMMYMVYQLLTTDKQFVESVLGRYKYIIVDEYQDINPLQERIIEWLSNNANICVVGDDDQCIYQWRGSFVENLLSFKDRYPNVQSIEISTNFRSSKVIVDSARTVIERNLSRLPKEISAWDEAKINFDAGDIYAIQFSTRQEELEFVLEKIEQLRGVKFVNNKGEEFALDYRDMAIFFRSVKNSADPYIKAFKERDIPFVVKGGGKLFEQNEVVLVVKALAYLANLTHAGKTYPDILKELYISCFKEKANADTFIEQLEQLKRSISLNTFVSLQGVFHQILNFMGATEFEFSETQLYNLGMLSQAITDFEAIYKKIKIEKIKYFLGFIEGYAKWNYEEGGSEDPTKINAIKLMTVHKAKGLQFPVVFIPELVSGLFPPKPHSRDWLIPTNLFNKDRYEGRLDDERRLFYVAITRSEKFLFLSCHGWVSGKKSSRFFSEFPKNLALTQPDPDPTRREMIDLKVTSPLRRFATSYSDLRYYDRCPYDYKLRFIFGFNPQIALALGYGKSIHNILNIVHSNYRTNPPDEETTRKLIDQHFFLRYCTAESMVNFRESAKRIIYNYIKNFGGEFNLILETEKAFEFALDQALISGKIDLIKRFNEEGGLEAIEIVDFKEHDLTELSTDYVKQLRLYAIASIRALGFHPQRATVHHLDEGTRSEVDISSKALSNVESNMRFTIDSIMNREFPKNPSDIKCDVCDWKSFCTKMK